MTQIPTESQNIHVIAGKLAGLFRFVNDKNETAKKNSTSTNRDRRLSITVPPMHHEICPLWRRLCFIILLCVVFFLSVSFLPFFSHGRGVSIVTPILRYGGIFRWKKISHEFFPRRIVWIWMFRNFEWGSMPNLFLEMCADFFFVFAD